MMEALNYHHYFCQHSMKIVLCILIAWVGDHSHYTPIYPKAVMLFHPTHYWPQKAGFNKLDGYWLAIHPFTLYAEQSRAEQRLTNVIDTLLNQHIYLAENIERESNLIANTLHEKVINSSKNLTDNLSFFSKALSVISILSLILIILIIWLYIGRKIFRPLNKIKNAMIKISNGNTEAELPVAEDNEVGDMVLALSKLKEHVLNVTNMAQYDGLTNLLNRREFDITLDKEFRRCKREKTSMSLMLCDIDFFKYYNDNYGHIAGDNCLVSCTKEMSSLFTRVTDSCFRYGGEEFAVIMVGVESIAAYNMAEKLRSNIEALKIEHATHNAPTLSPSVLD